MGFNVDRRCNHPPTIIIGIVKLRRRLVPGMVLIEVRVDAGGGVADARVIRSARPFDEPALDAARRWTFRPARVRGTPMATLAYIAFAFRQTSGCGGEIREVIGRAIPWWWM
jgi:TonB family protein